MKKRVNIGSQAGETPKKVQTFTFDSVPSSIPAATPQRDATGSTLKGVLAASNYKYGDTKSAPTSLYGSPTEIKSLCLLRDLKLVVDHLILHQINFLIM